MVMDAHGPLLTLPEIARRLGVSDTTARNWARAYGDLIGSEIGPDGYRRYALRRFEQVAALRERRLPAAAIRASLLGEAESPDTTPSIEERRVAALERIAVAVEGILDFLRRSTVDVDA